MQREKFAIRNIAIKQLATQGNKKLAKAVRNNVFTKNAKCETHETKMK